MAPFEDEKAQQSFGTELRSIREIVKDLSKPIAQKHLKKRRQGGKEILYIPWHFATQYLDHFAPGWNYEVKRLDNIGGKLVMTVRISIPALEGLIYREATGQEDDDKEGYGNASSNAESMALRRAAAKFGLALHLYDDGNPPPPANQQQNRNQPPANRPAPPPETPKISPADAAEERTNLILSAETLLGNLAGDDKAERKKILKGRDPQQMTITALKSLVQELMEL